MADRINIKGSIVVNKVRVYKTNIQYTLLFLDDRMIFVKTGGQSSDMSLLAIIGGLVFVVLFTAMEQLMLKQKKKEIKQLTTTTTKYITGMTSKEILQLDKNNFELCYTKINDIEVKNSVISLNGLRTGLLRICYNNRFDDYDIAIGQDLEKCRKLIKTLLPTKVFQP